MHQELLEVARGWDVALESGASVPQGRQFVAAVTAALEELARQTSSSCCSFPPGTFGTVRPGELGSDESWKRFDV